MKKLLTIAGDCVATAVLAAPSTAQDPIASYAGSLAGSAPARR